MAEEKVKPFATKHAAEKWQERVRPTLSLTDAQNDLVLTARRAGVLRETAPRWVIDYGPHGRERNPTRRYMMLGDDICLVLEKKRPPYYAITTVLTRGGLSPESRARRNERARHKRSRRQAKRRKNR